MPIGGNIETLIRYAAARASGRCSSLQGGEQGLEVVRVVVTHPVDVEGGRSVHAASHAAHEVFADPGGAHVLCQFLVEEVDVKSQLFGVGVEILVVEPPLILVEEVVH